MKAPSPSAKLDKVGLVRSRGTLLHRQIFIVLRDEISRGVYSSGALPNEEVLCSRFEVSRITVRRALADLARAGLVESIQGRGTFLRNNPAALRAQPSLSLVDSLNLVATQTRVRVLGVMRIAPPPNVAALLGIGPDEQAVRALRLRSIGDLPVMYTDAWVPITVGKKVTAASLQKLPLYEILMAQGVKFGRVVQEINAEVADPTMASLLRTEIGAPLLRLTRVLHDMQAVPVQHLSAITVAERSRLLMDVSVQSVNTLMAGQYVHDI